MAFKLGYRGRTACPSVPRVIFSAAAIRDLERLREFLRPKDNAAAKRAGQAIVNGVQLLGAHPTMGRPVEDLPVEYREWLIGFGGSGYVARYRINGEAVVILAVRHQKEAGFN